MRSLLPCPLLALALGVAACAPESSEPGEEARQEAGDRPDAQDEALSALEQLGYAAGYEPAGGPVGVTVHDPARAFAGLNLVVSAHAAEALLLDMDGELVHRWARAFEDTWPGRAGNAVRRGSWRRAHVLSDGGLLAIFTSLGVVRLDRDSELVWAWKGIAHHDLDVAPDGRVLVLTRKNAIVPDIDPEQPVLEDFVTVLSPEGEELRSISVLECLRSSEHAGLIEALSKGGDVLHTNTLELLDGRAAHLSPAFSAGNVLISVRQLDLIAVLDLEHRTCPWSRTGSWHRQHQPTLLADGAILLFDNLGTPRRSAVIELDALSGEERWVYRADEPDEFFSSGIGSCQRLPNGNTLVTESTAGRAFELTPAREIVWEWRSPFRATGDEQLVATLYEVVRLAPDAFP